jgi:hypothetical protein
METILDTGYPILTKSNWQETIEGMDSKAVRECDEEVFDYFLEVLPPVFMNKKFKFTDGLEVRASFGFAEGYEPITVFWREGKKYFLRRSNVINPLG